MPRFRSFAAAEMLPTMLVMYLVISFAIGGREMAVQYLLGLLLRVFLLIGVYYVLLLAVLPLCQRRAHVLHRSLQRLADAAQGGVILLSKGRLPGRKLSGLRIQLLLHPALELVVIRCTALLFAGAPEYHGQFQADGDQQKGIKSCQIFHKWFSPIIKIRVPQKAGPGVFYSNS